AVELGPPRVVPYRAAGVNFSRLHVLIYGERGASIGGQAGGKRMSVQHFAALCCTLCCTSAALAQSPTPCRADVSPPVLSVESSTAPPVVLTWTRSQAADFIEYDLYRSSSAPFVPSSSRG